MVSLQRRVLISAASLTLVIGVAADRSPSRFLPDDPLLREPPPRSVGQLQSWDIDDIYDLIDQTFVEPRRERTEEDRAHPSRNTNTLGEVPDSSWYTNRHWLRSMSLDELVRGPGNADPPDQSGSWRIVSGKTNGVTPGFFIEDHRGQRYLLKFDAARSPETGSAADVIGSKFFYALGYNVPENYIVHFRRSQLAIDSRSSFRDSSGRKRRLSTREVDTMLDPLPRDAQGRYRALASRIITGTALGPFQYTGTRSDDVNDVIPHQERRELRGLRVFDAWLNNTDAKAENSLDTVVEEGGRRFVRHYLIDFSAALGSDALDAKDPRLGHEYFIDPKPAAVQVATLGLYVPRWMRADYPHIRGVGHFESNIFDPVEWKTDYPNPAFALMDPDDAFWAAKQIASFRDDEIRAIVQTGQYSDPRAAGWVTRCLIERREKIVRAFFSGTLALDKFHLEGGRLRFIDWQAREGDTTGYQFQWFTFDNRTGNQTPVSPSGDDVVPVLPTGGDARYLVAEIARRGSKSPGVRIYLRRSGSTTEVVGIDRHWANSTLLTTTHPSK